MKRAPASLGSAIRAQSWASIAVLLALLSVVNFAYIPDMSLELSATTHGYADPGFAATYELLRELKLGATRTRSRYAELASDRPLWLLAPTSAEGLRTWIEAGGTALLIGPSERVLSELGSELTLKQERAEGVAHGSLIAHGLYVDAAASFEPSDQHESLLEIGDAPFAVLERVGAGQLIALSDAAPFTNQHLLERDHALLVVELARALGTPLLDERSHGLVNEATLLGALGPLRVLSLSAALLLLLVIVLWAARSEPAKELSAAAQADPSLSRYVEALTYSYGDKGPRELTDVYRVYLHGLRHRLRKALYGRRDASDALLGDRLARELAGEPETRATLEGRDQPRNAAELRRSVLRMEHYVAAGPSQARERPSIKEQ